MRIIATNGVDFLSMAALAQSTGLSRPAIYQYFASKEHVLGEILINEMADLSNEIDRLVSDIEDPMEQVRVWMHYSLAHLASSDHRVIRQISIDNLPADQRGMLRAMHGYFMMSLMTSLTSLGVSEPSSLASMIYAAVAAAAKRIDEGAHFTDQAESVERFIIAGVESVRT